MNYFKTIASILVLGTLLLPNPALALSPPQLMERLPFLRMYNPIINDHFYTTDRLEAYRAEQSHGYKMEGELGYVEKDQKTGTRGIIRMWNPNAKKHFYTINSDEASRAQASGYILEGTIGYLLFDTAPSSAPAGVDFAPPEEPFKTAVYRMYNSGLRKHFYTTSRTEMLTVQTMSYRLEGDLGTLYETSGKVCPDEWIVNQMPGPIGDTTPREYFIVDGNRVELWEYDVEWVEQYCGLEKQIVS